MESTLCLYKGKLKSAINLVPVMSPDGRVEAVNYWNELAEQLQQIFNVCNQTFGQQVTSGAHTNSNTIQNNLLYNEPIGETSIATKPQSNLDSSNLQVDTHTNSIMMALEQNHYSVGKDNFSDSYLEQTNSKSITSTEGTSVESVNQTAQQYPIAQTNLTCSTSPTTLVNAHRATNDSITINGQCCITEQPDMLGQVPDGMVEFTSCEITPYNSTSIELNVQNSPRIEPLCYSNEFQGKLNHHNIQPILYTNNNAESIVTTGDGATIPSTTEIGNGQFDRGPKQDRNLICFQNSETRLPDSLIVCQNPNTQRLELYSSSDTRPLQPIRVASFNGDGDYGGSRLDCDQIKCLDNENQMDEMMGLNVTPPYYGRILVDDSAYYEESSKLSSPHTCDICGKSGFSTKGNLKRHLKAHSGEKPFKCEYCKSCFTEKKSLKIHVRRHTGEKPYKCEICDKMFSQTGVLQSHMALHLDERKFDCHKCGKAFRQRSQLNLHLMRHDGVKRLGCGTCNAKFLTKGDLERHCRIHTGERPYVCKICSKSFTRQQSLNEHLNRHTGRKPYDCKYCGRTFSEMSACYKHVKTHKTLPDQYQHMQLSPLDKLEFQ